MPTSTKLSLEWRIAEKMKYHKIIFNRWPVAELRDLLYAGHCFRRYGYSRERFVWSLISAVGIFCLGCGATIVHGVQNLATAEVIIVQIVLVISICNIEISNYRICSCRFSFLEKFHDGLLAGL